MHSSCQNNSFNTLCQRVPLFRDIMNGYQLGVQLTVQYSTHTFTLYTKKKQGVHWHACTNTLYYIFRHAITTLYTSHVKASFINTILTTCVLTSSGGPQTAPEIQNIGTVLCLFHYSPFIHFLAMLVINIQVSGKYCSTDTRITKRGKKHHENIEICENQNQHAEYLHCHHKKCAIRLKVGWPCC